jgi:hypothetical protein
MGWGPRKSSSRIEGSKSTGSRIRNDALNYEKIDRHSNGMLSAKIFSAQEAPSCMKLQEIYLV